MPAKSPRKSRSGKRRTRFADTVKMSTYLVAVVIGPFELTTRSMLTAYLCASVRSPAAAR